MLTLLAALGCTDPEPVPPEPVLLVSEPVSELLEATANPEDLDLGPPLAMPWPAGIPCEQFEKVVVSGAYLQRPDGGFLETPGEQTTRRVAPQDLAAGLLVRPDLDPVRITANCSGPRERVIWSCTAKTGCALDFQRIAQAPELPLALLELDRAALAATVPKGGQVERLEPLVRAGIAHSLSMLRACQAQGCSSQAAIESLMAWSGPLPTPTVTETLPWKLIYKKGKTELQFGCQPHACSLRTLGPIQTRLDLQPNAQTLYVPPGRLDYRDEGDGPRVAFSGPLVPLVEAPAD